MMVNCKGISPDIPQLTVEHSNRLSRFVDVINGKFFFQITFLRNTAYCFLFYTPIISKSTVFLSISNEKFNIRLISLLTPIHSQHYIDKVKNTVRLLGLTFTPDMKWSDVIESIAFSNTRKIVSLCLTRFFLLSEPILHFYKSNIRTGIDYCCHFWSVTHDVHLVILDTI